MKRQREHWGSRIGFLMATAGSAIGLGTLWKFPYVTGANGGGAFVLLYLLFVLAIGIPVFVAELIVGRAAQRGPVGIFIALAPNRSGWRLAGWLGFIAAFVILSYYSVVSGWGLNYVLLSLTQSFANRSPQEISGAFSVLQQATDINLFWHAIFMLITMGVVYQGVRAGIERWSRIMMGGLFAILLGLFFYGLTLDGFGEAVRFMLWPDLSKMTAAGALEALGLALFTLSLGHGVMLTYGSYMQPHESIPRTALLISGMVLIIALLSGLTIFPIIFAFGMTPSGGEGLVFKTLPVLFAQLPGGLVISTVFFLLLVFAALTSAVAFLEVVVANFMDLYGWSRRKGVFILGGLIFLAGVPSALSESSMLLTSWKALFGTTFFATMDGLVSHWVLPLDALLIALFAGWGLDRALLHREFQAGMSNRYGFLIWRFLVRWVVPVAILMVLLQWSGIVDLDRIMQRT
jgi:neurotransmitter:Na+ symporter, NSS family